MIRDAVFPFSRRAMIAGGLAAAAFRSVAAPPQGLSLVAGTYDRGGGKGLYPLASDGGGWTVGTPVPSIANVSFGARAPRSGLFYFIREAKSGELLVHDRDLRPLGTRSSGGSGPCHVTLAPDLSAVAMANYGSGTVALWALDRKSGLPVGEVQVVQHAGSGPNAARQAGPHAHWVGFTRDGRWLHAVDLGADAIFAYPYDPAARRLGDMRAAFQAPAGSGPRHLARHPRLPVCYLLSELANTLTVLAASEDGTFRAVNVLPTLPAGFGGASQAAHIAVNAAGTRLYVSNRGHNSITVFALAPDGAAELIQHADCGGDWPRFFLLIEGRREMLVGNERSGTVARLALEQDGRLRPTSDRLVVPGVAFLAVR